MYMKLHNLRRDYLKVVDAILVRGVRQAPRGLPTLALSNVHLEITDLGDVLPIGVGRKINPAIAAVEAVQIIGGFVDPALMQRISKSFAAFTEEDGRFWGGYGERIGSQLIAAGHKLQKDIDTRQAVVTLWQPTRDNVPGKHDYPCTLSLCFQMFDGKLELSVTMRSNDVWLGLAYDVFVFTQLQLTMARWLRVEPGPYHHHAVNLHLYERDIKAAEKLHLPEGDDAVDHPLGFGRLRHTDLFQVLMRARAIGRGEEVRSPTLSEQWYTDKLAPYMEMPDAVS